MFRLLFLTFSGKTRGHLNPHESPLVMTVPLIILSVGSVIMGLPGSPWMNHWFQNFLAPHHEEMHMSSFVVTTSVSTSIVGFIAAFIFYVIHPTFPQRFAKKYWFLHALSYHKLWIDEIYQATVIRWFKQLANLSFQFDQGVIDRAVNETGLKTVWLSRIKNWIDQNIVDGLVNFTGWAARSVSSVLKLVQTGYVHNYLFFLLLGVLIILYTVINT